MRATVPSRIALGTGPSLKQRIDVELFLKHPLGSICSDGSALSTEGPLSRGSPHPRNYGAFPRVLGVYCRERKLMSAFGVHTFTFERRPAGQRSPSYFAVCIFDVAVLLDLLVSI